MSGALVGWVLTVTRCVKWLLVPGILVVSLAYVDAAETISWAAR